MHERSRYTYHGEMRPGFDRPEWGGIFGFPGAGIAFFGSSRAALSREKRRL